MKRNKPIVKHRSAGTQNDRRRRYYFNDRRTEAWTLIVPQSVTGDEARTVTLAGAVPNGFGGSLTDPQVSTGLYRWSLDTGSRYVSVYTAFGGWWSWYPESRFGSVPHNGDVWYGFTAECKCTRDRCPLTRYTYADNNAEVSMHRPGFCPLAALEAPVWRYAGRLVL